MMEYQSSCELGFDFEVGPSASRTRISEGVKLASAA